jgi:hypothetical protein
LKETSRVDEGGVSADAAAIVKSPDNGMLAGGDGLIGWGQDSSSDQSAGPVLDVDTTRPTGRTPATLLSAFGESQPKSHSKNLHFQRELSPARMALPRVLFRYY